MMKRLQRLAVAVMVVCGQIAVIFTAAPMKTLADTLPGDLTQYAMPTTDASPGGLAPGPDGALWFTETLGNKIGRISTSGAITEYAIPTSDSRPQAITAGPDGALWFTELFGNKIGRITTSGAITEQPLPASNSFPSRLTVGADGALWFSARSTVNGTDGYSIMRMTTAGAFSRFPVTPFGITTSITDVQSGNDGAIWFAMNAQTSGSCTTKLNWIGRMTTSGGVTYYQLPQRCNAPLRLTIGFDGAWWFTQSASNTGSSTVGRFVAPSSLTDYPLSTSGVGATELTTGSDGAVWFSENGANKLGRITHDGVIKEYDLPSSMGPSMITSGPDGNIWFVAASVGEIAKLTLPPETPFSGDLAYVKYRPSGGSVMEAVDFDKASSTTTLTSTNGSARYLMPAFNQDRTRLYYSYQQTATPALRLKPDSPIEGTAALRCDMPMPSPDNTRLACFTLSAGARTVKIVTLANYQETIVPIPGVGSTAVLQPRIDWLTNSSLLITVENPGCATSYLARVNIDGGGFAPLTSTVCNSPRATGGRVSPDGSKIVYAADNGVWTMNVDGTGQKLITPSTQEALFQNPAWSRDGKYVSATGYNTTTPNQNTRLVVIDAQTGAVVKTLLQQGDYAFGESDWIGTYTPPDSTAPTVTGALDREADSNGWYNHDVTINWQAMDPTPSSGTPTTPPSTLVNQEGEHTYTSQQSCDPAGNCAAGSATVKLDKTVPHITYALSATANVAGWNNEDVTVTFTCDDAISGMASCSEPVTVHEGANQTITGTAVDMAGNTKSIEVVLNVDVTNPTISRTFSATANAAGWFNNDVTIDYDCSDALSGLLSCSPPITLSEGMGQSVTGTAVDVAGNRRSITDTINIDKAAPILGAPSWTANPKSTLQSTTLSVPVSDSLSGLAGGEYFIGDSDPGVGNGATMQTSGSALTTTFGTDFQPGVYKISYRAQDAAGNWSATASDYLVVYDPFGFSISGKHAILPALGAGDALPGLIASDQTERATFAFNVKYDAQGVIAGDSDLMFSYATGTKCSKPSQATNCHNIELNATNIAWLVVNGANNSQGMFQGQASVVVDGVTMTNPIRVTGIDGSRLGGSSDHFTLEIFAHGADPNTAEPLYHVSQDVVSGNIKIR